MNECGACGEDFASVAMFDAHRVGKHDLDYPTHANGRRCLDAGEMVERGWAPNARGAWHDPEATASMRARFARPSTT